LSTIRTSSSTSPRQDGKRGQSIDSIANHFKSQPTPNSCYTNCIYNILDELSRNDASPQIGLSESRINDICRSKEPFGPKPEAVVPNLNTELKKWGYRTYETLRTSYSRLVGILTDDKSSFPIIGLSYDYLVDRKVFEPFTGGYAPPDHTVVVLSCDSSDVIFFDPFQGLSAVMQRQSQGLGKGVSLLPTPRALDYWQRAVFPSWAFWVSRVKGVSASDRTKSSALETYISVE